MHGANTKWTVYIAHLIPLPLSVLYQRRMHNTSKSMVEMVQRKVKRNITAPPEPDLYSNLAIVYRTKL